MLAALGRQAPGAEAQTAGELRGVTARASAAASIGMVAGEACFPRHAASHVHACQRGNVPSSPEAATSSGEGVSPAAMAAALTSRLRMFVLRAKAKVEDVSAAMPRFGLWDGAMPAGASTISSDVAR